jgi:hypothetical protein
MFLMTFSYFRIMLNELKAKSRTGKLFGILRGFLNLIFATSHLWYGVTRDAPPATLTLATIAVYMVLSRCCSARGSTQTLITIAAAQSALLIGQRYSFNFII